MNILSSYFQLKSSLTKGGSTIFYTIMILKSKSGNIIRGLKLGEKME